MPDLSRQDPEGSNAGAGARVKAVVDEELGMVDTGLPADGGGAFSTPEDASMIGHTSPGAGYRMEPGAAGDMSGGDWDHQDDSGIPPKG